jgi:SsrA-binding protein
LNVFQGEVLMQEKVIQVANNKKARFEYEIIDTFEAGIVLLGTEVKALRMKKVNIEDSYARVENGEMFIIGINISQYEMGNRFNHDPLRDRKLLLHQHEIKRLTGKLKERGFTLIPLQMYFKNSKVKILLGLGRGKAKYDKRRTIQKRDQDREMQREWRNR